jgi:hypothetical protein
MAEDTKERQALDRRYDKALRDAAKRGAEAQVRDFETAAASSLAVIARPFKQTLRLAESNREGYPTYYQLVKVGARFPMGEKWDTLRDVADAALFGPYRENIRFAALSLDGQALANYGEMSWVLREDMIEHRASVFEENSVLFMKHHKIRMDRAHKMPRGRRATWSERSKLCVAKLAAKIDATTATSDLPGILLRQGKTTADDDFVEVHIGGSMTVHTLERVILMKGNRRRRKTIAKALKMKLKHFGVELET